MPDSQRDPGAATTRERIVLPYVAPVTEEEKERRRTLIEEARQLREKIGPISVPTYELIREDRDEGEM